MTEVKLRKRSIGLPLLLLIFTGGFSPFLVMCIVSLIFTGTMGYVVVMFKFYIFMITTVTCIYLSGKYNKIFKYISSIASMLVLSLLCISISKYYDSYLDMSKWFSMYTKEATPYWNLNIEKEYKKMPVSVNCVTGPIILFRGTNNLIKDLNIIKDIYA